MRSLTIGCESPNSFLFQDWLRACRRNDWSQITPALLVGQTSGSTSWREVRSVFGLLLFGFFNFRLQPDHLVDLVSWPPSVGGQSRFISPFLLGKPALTSHSSTLLVGLAFGPLSCLAAFGKRLSALHVERPSLHFLVSRVTQRTASY